MPISNEDREILIKSAGVEVASARLPFSEHTEAIELYFHNLEKRQGSEFEWHTYKEPSSYNSVYGTSLGTFDLTPEIGKLLVPQEEGEPLVVQFFSAADETASLVSATVRFTERRLDFVKKQHQAAAQPQSQP